MYVAPEIMSIFALARRDGFLVQLWDRVALICWSRGSWLGYSTAVVLVSLPLVTVICTWTGPYRVSAASPVTVFVAEAGADDDDDDDDDAVEDVPPERLVLVPDDGVLLDVVGSGVLIAAGGVAMEVVCVLKDSSMHQRGDCAEKR